MTNRRALQALTLAALAAISIALPTLGSSGATILRAQNGAPPLHAHAHHAIPLNGSVPRALQNAKRTGVESGGRQLHLVISLQLSDPDGLTALIASQQNAKAPQYHKYLSTKDFIARYAPSTQAVAAVRQFLNSSGLKVAGVSANRTLISASGSVAQAERAFGVTILQYQLGKRTVYGPDRAPRIPDTLAGSVLNISGLDNVLVAQPLISKQTPLRATQQNTAHASTATDAATRATQATTPASGPVWGAYNPTILRSAYNVVNLINAGGDGLNQRIAVFELAPYIPSDLGAYESQYGLTSVGIANHSVDGAPPTCATAGSACDAGGVIEADLDVEVAAALAPDATLDVYTGPNTGQGVLDTYNQIVLADADAVATTSWGLCEPASGDYMLYSLDQIFAQAAAQGQTVAAASGDSGSDDCLSIGEHIGMPNVDSPASDPYVLGVGGTTLSVSGNEYVGEAVWNSVAKSNSIGATGGGISSYFSRPWWQVGAHTNFADVREVPDVSADADPQPGYSVYCTSTSCDGAPYFPWINVGGTSAAAPLWAGVLTDINTYLAAHAAAGLGWANPTLYQLFSNNQTYWPFYGVDAGGSNDIDFPDYTPYEGDYGQVSCFSLTTGMGSPNVWNIAQDVQSGVQHGGGGPCPDTTPPTTQLIANGGFENGATDWTQYSSGGYSIIGSYGQPHTGKQLAFTCEYPDCDDRISQTITVPATFTWATLTFWVSTQSDFPVYLTNPPCVDHLYVTLATTDGTVISGGQALNSCVSQAVFGYQFEQFQLGNLLQAYAGQQLILTLRGTTTNEAPVSQAYTGWYIDDISLTVS